MNTEHRSVWWYERSSSHAVRETRSRSRSQCHIHQPTSSVTSPGGGLHLAASGRRLMGLARDILGPGPHAARGVTSGKPAR